jgi:dipeptide/tripeptide permease
MVKKKHFLDHAELRFGREFVTESKSILSVIIVFLPQIIFWALVQQQSSRWIFQAKKMDRVIGGLEIQPDQLVVFVPIFIVILVPIFEKFLFPQIAKIGITSPLQKMGCGMGCSVIAFLISAYIETQISEKSLSIFLLLPQYILIAAAEVFVWISSVQFAYSQSPAKMKSVMNSFVYLVVAFGNLIVLIISGTQIFDSQVYEFLFFALLMLLDAIAFVFIAMRYKYVADVNNSEDV